MLYRGRSSIGGLLAAAAMLGCYEYVPTPTPASLVGQRVELTLSDSGMVALANQIGPSTEMVEGRLLSDSADTYVLAMSQSRTRFGTEMDWRGERVAFPHRLTTAVAERRFSVTRSAFIGALAAVGVTGVTVGLRGNGQANGSGGTGTKPPPQ